MKYLYIYIFSDDMGRANAEAPHDSVSVCVSAGVIKRSEVEPSKRFPHALSSLLKHNGERGNTV